MHKAIIPESALSQHIAVLGKTGSGKTSTAKLLIEQVVATGNRVCILDPIKSDWWGLTSSADGKRPGLPFHILGGPRGHVPLHDAAGKAIAEVVATGSLPLSIIDMADFRPGGQAKFFVDFAPVLLKRIRGVLFLVLEEAHIFAPKEKTGVGDENMSTYWCKMLATAGRSKGIRLIVLTQRTQALHNAVLGSCDSLIAHRLTAPADQAPVTKWLQANATKDVTKEVSDTLAGLKTGEAWLCSGEALIFERRQFPRISTYDNTRTPTTEDGEHHVKTAAVDADQLKAIIGEAVKEAEANDPKLLKATIAKLEKQLAEKPKAAADTAAIEKARKEGAKARDLEWEPIVKSLERWNRDLTGRMAKAERIAEELPGLLHVNGDAPKVNFPASNIPNPIPDQRRLAGKLREPQADSLQVGRTAQRPVHPITPKVKSELRDGGDSQLGKCERAILQVLAQHPDGCRSGKLTLLAGYRFSGGFRNSLAALRTGGLIQGENSGTMRITEAGLDCGPFDPLPEGQDLVDYWLRHPSLGKCEREILSTLIQNPDGATAEELCAATGYEFSGGFRNALSDLRTAGLIVGGNRERMKAAETLLA